MKQLKENKMGVMPIKKLLINMSIPIMISMLIQAFYNVVDSIFVARISENALTAVSLSFPVQNLMIEIGVGTSVASIGIFWQITFEHLMQSTGKIFYI